MEQEYGVIEQRSTQFPVRELLRVPHGDNDLIVSYPAFGQGYYRSTLEAMSKTFLHPETQEKISFKPATASQSISAAVYGFGAKGKSDAKRDIFDRGWLQLCYVVRTSKGVFTNTQIQDESQLKRLLDSAEEVNGIYLIDDNTAFAPDDSFQRGLQDVDTFAQGGLARALEHTRGKVAENLREIAPPKHYKKGVNVWGFDGVKKPILRVASLLSDGGLDGGWLGVYGSNWGNSLGYAFGVPFAENSTGNE